jgi:hypothetical protein
MENVTIKKAKIKDKLFLEGEYSEQLPGHSRKNTKFDCTVPVHIDLNDAFQQLSKHLAILCDEIPLPARLENVNADNLLIFGVRSFSVGGSDENEGVTVSGFKEGMFGIINLNTPFTKFKSEDYNFCNELSLQIQTCIYEVEQYLFGGKRAPEQQMSLFPEEEDFNTGEAE